MTVNERFYALGMLEAFHTAFQARDRETMIALYQTAEIEDAATCVDDMLANPERYRQ